MTDLPCVTLSCRFVRPLLSFFPSVRPSFLSSVRLFFHPSSSMVCINLCLTRVYVESTLTFFSMCPRRPSLVRLSSQERFLTSRATAGGSFEQRGLVRQTSIEQTHRSGPFFVFFDMLSVQVH